MERQLDALRRTISPDDTLIGAYDDYAMGSRCSTRGLDRAMAELGAGRADALRVMSTDRLKRSKGELRRLKEMLGSCGKVLQIISPITS